MTPAGPTPAIEPRVSARLPAAPFDVVEVEVVVEEGADTELLVGVPLEVREPVPLEAREPVPEVVDTEVFDAGLEEPETEPV